MNTSTALLETQILYVEDEKETRDALFDFLRRRAGKIYVAKNGREGLELYREFKPDIVIADLFMPEMGGIEMIKEIKSDGSNPSVIITSALDDVSVILNAVDAGIDKYIIKPIDINELLEELTRFAGKRMKKNSAPFVLENKKQTEDLIKKDFAAFLKTSTGKGPKDVKVFIHSNILEITAAETLTCLEKNILDNGQNMAIIKEYRGLFYSIKEKDICRMVGSSLKRKVTLDKVIIDAHKDLNRLVFSIA